MALASVGRLLRRCWHEDDGLTTVEYALLLCLVSLAAMGAFGKLGCSAYRVAATASNALRTR